MTNAKEGARGAADFGTRPAARSPCECQHVRFSFTKEPCRWKRVEQIEIRPALSVLFEAFQCSETENRGKVGEGSSLRSWRESRSSKLWLRGKCRADPKWGGAGRRYTDRRWPAISPEIF